MSLAETFETETVQNYKNKIDYIPNNRHLQKETPYED